MVSGAKILATLWQGNDQGNGLFPCRVFALACPSVAPKLFMMMVTKIVMIITMFVVDLDDHNDHDDEFYVGPYMYLNV